MTSKEWHGNGEASAIDSSNDKLLTISLKRTLERQFRSLVAEWFMAVHKQAAHMIVFIQEIGMRQIRGNHGRLYRA